MRKFLFLVLMLLLTVWTTAGAQTPAKGMFTVADGKTVQFATENSVYNANDLIQWDNVGAVTTAGWDVLTGEEWAYLLAGGRTNANDLNALGTVNGQKGLIILPDEWNQPVGAPTFTPVSSGIGYEYNVYTADQWAVMAESGAVFLPCGGYGYEDGEGYHVEDVTDHGSYWAKDVDVYNVSKANCMRFSLDAIHDFNQASKTNYYSIRLVRDVTVTELDENDDPETFATKLEAANDFDFAVVRRTLYKDGAFNTICLPFNVANIENSPLAGADVYEFVSGEVTDGLLQVNIEKVTTGTMEKGVPYLIRWDNTGETISNLTFEGLTASDWDDATAESVTNNNVTYQGFYGKTHITDDGTNHYNFFLGENNELLWPEDGNDPAAKMKGFRAYFYITPGGGPNPAPMYRGMPAAFRIKETATAIDQANSQEPKAKSQKLFHDGQIVLIINGETYTMKGQRL